LKKKFNERVYQFLSTLFSEWLDNALYQYPVKAREKFRNRIGYALADHTKEKFDRFLAEV
jgi:hypothetical protein